ncbi:MAG: hypothetical protein HYU64_15795 [Armatimonadetes bacterium]|nr:hypothetical protein [Armatimonadota bacterium]
MSEGSSKTTALLVMTIFLLVLVGQAAGKSGTLDGKIFSGVIGEKGQPAAGKEQLTFKDGRFRALSGDAYGFGSASYKTKIKGTAITFEATTVSAKEGKILWRGAVTGSKLQATASWSMPGHNHTHDYWVKADLKK